MTIFKPLVASALLALISLAAATPAQAQTFASTKLKDVITSGSGNIDLFRAASGSKQPNPTATSLEWLRADNNNALVFAVDVNEAANGTEKASSQAITVKSAKVVAVISGTTHEFTEFSTRTQASVAEGSSTARSLQYTMIGDTGSSRITSNSSSDIFGSDFDATLRVEVPQSLSGASSVRLVVTFMDTNVALGDPEAFYDYSNGFEDVAIVTASDAAYLDGLQAGQAEAPMVIQTSEIELLPSSNVYLPAVDKYYVVAYEDQFPNKGDYDFNDLVVAYRVYLELNNANKVVGIGGIGYLVARGGGFDHDWFLRINLTGSASGNGELVLFEPNSAVPASGYPQAVNFNGPLNMKVFANTFDLWVDPGQNFVNTLRDQAIIAGHRFSFHVRLNSPMSASQMPQAPFDPYLYVYNTRYEIHLDGNAAVHPNSRNTADGLSGFRDQSNYPYALIMPEDWLTPIEYIDLGEAYPEFLEFVISNGSSKPDWYRRPASRTTKDNPPSKWKW